LVGSGKSPEHDECHLDGCYFDEDIARQVFAVWGVDYPDYVVELVRVMVQKPPGVAFTEKEMRSHLGETVLLVS
jgi:hypothetical protein